MNDATKPAGDLVQRLQILGADFRSHPIANGTIERTKKAGELMYEAADEIDRLTAALADRERAIADMRSIGGQLTNVAYNFAQKTGYRLTSEDAAMFDKLRREWDAAIRARSGLWAPDEQA